MTIAEPAQGQPPARLPFGYAFDGVVLERARGRLLVDGRDVAAGAMPLKLLVVLCQSPGLLVSRQRLFDEIWPRQTVSDEALTKLIARLRDTLGAHGRHVVTLRGQGVRLDAAVTALDAPLEAEPVPPVASEAGSETATPALPASAVSDSPPERRSGRWRWRLVAGIAVMALLGWAIVHVALRQPPLPAASDILSAGYAINAADLDNGKPETLTLLREAEAALTQGQTERARTVLQVAHDSDTATPVPGILLGILNWPNRREANGRLQHEFNARIDAATTPYIRLLARLVDDFPSRPDAGESTLAALTAMRPSAWRLQMRLAHYALAQRREAAALQSLRQMPVNGIPPDIIMMSLADRASLGDLEAVAGLLADDVLASAPAHREYTLGRLAWTRDDTDAAIAHMDAAAITADRNSNFWLEILARRHAALFAYRDGRADAIGRVERVLALIRRTSTHLGDIAELEALLAEPLWRDGDRAKATDILRGIDAMDVVDGRRAGLELFNARLGFVVPRGSFLDDARRSSQPGPTDAGWTELMAAWTAHAQHDDDTARRELAQARSQGIDQTYFREDADALDALLSQRTHACHPDPPYPNLLRFSTCRVVAVDPTPAARLTQAANDSRQLKGTGFNAAADRHEVVHLRDIIRHTAKPRN